MKEEVPMKHLRIESGKGQYSIDGENWADIDKIQKADMLILIDHALKDDFIMDTYARDRIQNPAHEIIYRNLHAKLAELTTKRERFHDESQQLYREAIQKYRAL